MYVHKECPAVGSRRDDNKPDGIYLHGEILTAFNGDGRHFFADLGDTGSSWVKSIDCLDCEAEVSSFTEPVELWKMEEFLSRGDFDSKIGWLD